MKKDFSAILVAAILGSGFFLLLYQLRRSSFPRNPRTFLTAEQADRKIESAKVRLQARPEDLDSLRILALAYYQKGPDYYVDGLNALERARRLGASDPRLFYFAGAMYEGLALPRYAIPEYEKFLRHHPEDYEVDLRLAKLYFHERRLDQAVAQYQKAREKWPRDPTLLFNLGLVYKEKGNGAEAKGLWQRVLKLSGELPEQGYYQWGDLCEKEGRWDEAQALYKRELQRSPNFLPALEALAELHRKQGREQEAKVLAKRIEALRPHAAHPPRRSRRLARP